LLVLQLLGQATARHDAGFFRRHRRELQIDLLQPNVDAARTRAGTGASRSATARSCLKGKNLSLGSIAFAFGQNANTVQIDNVKLSVGTTCQ
jgi:hypothetical protein